MIIKLEEHYSVLPCTLEAFFVKGAKKSLLIIPGGAYSGVSPREGAPVAKRFNQYGYNAFVLTYATADRFAAKDMKFPAQLLQAAAAMDYIRNMAREWKISKKIAVCGFSAGGHLAASLSTLYAKNYVLSKLGLKAPRSARPDASILSYPVISALKNPHEGSILNITGGDVSLYREISLEKQVKKSTPPAFLWHTADDKSVNVSNSMDYAAALSKKGVPFELHVFSSGQHGLSLCDSTTDIVSEYCAVWVQLAVNWLKTVL